MSSDEVGDLSRRFETALAANDLIQARNALRELEDRRRHGEDVQVPFPGAQILDLVGPDAELEDLLGFLRLVQDSAAFSPPLSWREAIRLEIDALLGHGGDQSAYSTVAIDIIRDEVDAIGAAREAIWWIWERGLRNQREREAAAQLVSYLLDGGADVRQSVLESLRPWLADPDFAYVVFQVLPELTAEERDRLSDDS